jgi:hypothetical protein
MVNRKLREPAGDVIASRKQPSKPSPPQPDALLSDLRQLVAEAQRSAAAAINIGLTMLYWRVGKRIRDEVLAQKRADCGEEIVATRSRQLAAAGGHSPRYRWPQRPGGELFSQPADDAGSSQHSEDTSQHKPASFQHKPHSSQHKTSAAEHGAAFHDLAKSVRVRKRARPEEMRRVIRSLCAVQALTLSELAELLGRAPASLQNHYLTPMLKAGSLQLLFPHHPNHPQQRYRAGETDEQQQ